MTEEAGGADGAPLTKRDFEALAQFRFGIRRYLRFSEETVRRDGLTPQQYQLLLALKGFPRAGLGHGARGGRPAPVAPPQRGRAGQPRPGRRSRRAGVGPG